MAFRAQFKGAAPCINFQSPYHKQINELLIEGGGRFINKHKSTEQQYWAF